MAGERIFMRGDLDTDPRVLRIAFQLQIADVHVVIGKLWWLWSRADTHTEDGFFRYWLPEILDQQAGVTGFADALVAVGWLEVTPEGVRIPRFSEYNGKSAKRRLKNAQRMYAIRNECAQPRAQDAHTNAHMMRTECAPESESGTESVSASESVSEKKGNLPEETPRDGEGGADKPRPRTRGRTSKPSLPLPDDFAPDEAHAALAAKLGVDLSLSLGKFKAHAEANGRRQSSWKAAFTQWLYNAQTYDQPRRYPSTPRFAADQTTQNIYQAFPRRNSE